MLLYYPTHFIAPDKTDEGWLSQANAMELWLGMREIQHSPLPPVPLGTVLGFVATVWREGTPLTPADATPEFLVEMGNYIGACSSPPLAPHEHARALARLQSVLYWNVWEALGEDAAEQTRAWSALLEQSEWLPQARTYADGRMTPHEWIRTPQGQVYKADCIGYEPDHTIVGRQAYIWDIAGAIVEWGLDEETFAPLLKAAQRTGKGIFSTVPEEEASVSPDLLTAYRLAYAAFRVGQTHLCASTSGHDPAEQTRLWNAYSRYKNILAHLLHG